MKLRNLIFGLFLAIGAIGFTACTGNDGATGPAGPPGPAPDVDDIVDEVIDRIEDDMPNPDNCTIFADRGRTLVGSNGDDIMCGNERKNKILGGDGDDTIFGREGNDDLYGERHHDTLYGGAGNDTLTGGRGIDELYGEAGNDTLMAEGEDDILDGGEGMDTVSYGGEGVDPGEAMFFSVNLVEGYTEVKSITSTGDGAVPSADDRAKEGDLREELIDIENIIGSSDPDVLIGDANNNVITGGLGEDYIDGGGGSDTVSYEDSKAAVTVNLGNSRLNAGGTARGDDLNNIENVIGSDVEGEGEVDDIITGDGMNNELSGGMGDDRLTGMGGNDTLLGGPGSDTLNGGAGNDRLNGGPGGDTLIGGDGADTFIVAKGEYGREGDVLSSGFKVADGDVIVLKGFTTAEQTHRDTIVDTTGDNALVKVMDTTVLTVTGVKDLRYRDLKWER